MFDDERPPCEGRRQKRIAALGVIPGPKNRMSRTKLVRSLSTSSVLTLLAAGLAAQPHVGSTDSGAAPTLPSSEALQRGKLEAHASRYILGPGDALLINVLEADEIPSGPILIDTGGRVSLPMVGHIRAAGLTTEQFAVALTEELLEYIRRPQIAVSVAEFRSQPVSVIGAVGKPGVHYLRGPKTLAEVLSLAEGLRDDAGHRVQVTRRREWGPIPIAGASDDSTGQFSIAEIDLDAVIEGHGPEQNLFVLPHDVVSVPRAETVYVVGAVQRAGGFVLKEREEGSVLQALSLAGGLDRNAAPARARILRAASGGLERSELPIDLKRIMAGKSADVPLRPDDVLFVPRSGAKIAAGKVAEAALRAMTGVIIWRR